MMLGRKEGTKNELTQWENFLSLLPPALLIGAGGTDGTDGTGDPKNG